MRKWKYASIASQLKEFDMNGRIFVAVIFFINCVVWADDASLKDPTAPFNSAVAPAVNNSRKVLKPSGLQWNLGGILISDESKKAMLNGRWYNEQDYVDGWQLSLIEASAVILKRVGKTQRVPMYPTLTTSTVNLQPE